MSTHFSWLQFVPGVNHENLHIATGVSVGMLLIVLALIARISLGTGETAVMPTNRFSVRGIFEVITDTFANLAVSLMGEKGVKYVPLFCTIFLYVLINNFVGLLPGMSPATDNINTTFAIGIFSFLAYNFIGLKEEGFNYLKHFLGPVIWLAPLMLPIELISHAFRPVTLGLRLSGNMTGDHAVLSSFLEMFPIGVPIIFYMLGMLVCVIQAVVFTLLTMTYVMMAMAHDH